MASLESSQPSIPSIFITKAVSTATSTCFNTANRVKVEGFELKVENAESYSNVMQQSGITAKIELRKSIILEHSNALAEGVKGHIVWKSALLDEVANLVEVPVLVLGQFKESFLELPKDLLIMVMQKHQKYFSITNGDGRLLPYFITVANGAINEAVVRKGNEAVLRARYEDAKFFYETDTRKKYSEFKEQLSGILFMFQ